MTSENALFQNLFLSTKIFIRAVLFPGTMSSFLHKWRVWHFYILCFNFLQLWCQNNYLIKGQHNTHMRHSHRLLRLFHFLVKVKKPKGSQALWTSDFFFLSFSLAFNPGMPWDSQRVTGEPLISLHLIRETNRILCWEASDV